jgi:hypothetical protein
VLVLLGLVSTDFIITLTLSAADGTAHIVENPFMHELLRGLSPTAVNIGITLLLIGLLHLCTVGVYRQIMKRRFVVWEESCCWRPEVV